jgi:hypothetical protein
MTKAKTQRHEVEAWLGDSHGLDGELVAEFERQSDLIAARYPDPDDETERETARTAAYEVLSAGKHGLTHEALVVAMGDELGRARSQERAALVRIEQAASMLVEPPESKPKGVRSQSGFAKAAGVDRMTVLKWLGLR